MRRFCERRAARTIACARLMTSSRIEAAWHCRGWQWHISRMSHPPGFFLRGSRHTHHDTKRTGSRTGNRMKRNGRANKPRQLAGRSDPARSHAHPDSRAEGLRQRYGLAGPQLHLVSLGTCEANCAWRGAVSMHSSMRKARGEAGRAGAMPNLPTRARQKSRCADPQKGVR